MITIKELIEPKKTIVFIGIILIILGVALFISTFNYAGISMTEFDLKLKIGSILIVGGTLFILLSWIWDKL